MVVPDLLSDSSSTSWTLHLLPPLPVAGSQNCGTFRGERRCTRFFFCSAWKAPCRKLTARKSPKGLRCRPILQKITKGWSGSEEPKSSICSRTLGTVFLKGAGCGEVSLGPGLGSWCYLLSLAQAHSCCCLLFSGAKQHSLPCSLPCWAC